jgi:hypothetical protein
MENVWPVTMGTKAVFIPSCIVNTKTLLGILEEAREF